MNKTKNCDYKNTKKYQKLNVKINGIPVTPQYNPEFAFLFDDNGKPTDPWTWQIYSGMTLEFDLKITAVPEHV